jgi:hypothetical protein
MASDALRAVNSILQYQQQREDRKVQEALALMQFGMQKRQADMKEAETRLAAAEKGNQMFQLDVAQQWIPASGLEGIYASVPDAKGMDSDEISNNIDDLVDMLRSKDYGKFSETEATNIASAMWTFRNTQDPSSILSLANRFNSASSALMGDMATDEEVAFLNSFDKIKTDADLLGLSESASKALKNQYDITQEYLEFAEGDYDIQSNLGVLSQPVQDEFQQIQDEEGLNISNLADSMEDDLIPDDDIKGETILEKTPMSNQQILDSIDYLSDDEKVRTKEELDKITSSMKLLENKISELIDKRDERLDLWDSFKEEQGELRTRYEYFNKVGETNKAEEAYNRLLEIANQLSPSGKIAHESEAKSMFESRPGRKARYGTQFADYVMSDDSSFMRHSPHKDTYTDRIAILKDRLNELEQERNSFSR